MSVMPANIFDYWPVLLSGRYGYYCGSPWLAAANHTSNTGIILNPAEAEVTTKTVDIVVVHLKTNRME